MLPDYPNLLLFMTATITLNLIPGADVMYVASQSLASRRQGVLATLGISSGIMVYVLATALGLAEILHQSVAAFNLIKIIGAAYLLYLAWQAFNTKASTISIKNSHVYLGYTAYYKGVLTTLLNPKVGIFFLTFLPQFVDPSRGSVGLQIASLGICFIVSGTIINLMYAFLFFHLKNKLFTKSHLQQWLNKFTSIIFCGIALKILTAEQN